ncbi:hypothetical protein [Silvimonas iriomotensis]|uniref:Integrase n=1 Tax=Silvimonas iriomotensis TaxID=449662 RepID=A0ABQ2PCG5_9NEIS|nr:hypothetical protein [Silvimonas iriomotensis]GGP23018.1 hypothetical protein GCM10010970_30180 [Silvimonas iriomotensis]
MTRSWNAELKKRDFLLERFDNLEESNPIVYENLNSGVAVRYNDISWNLTELHRRKKHTVIKFDYWDKKNQDTFQKNIITQSKKLIYIYFKSQKDRRSIDVILKFSLYIRLLALESFESGCLPSDILKNHTLVEDLFKKHNYIASALLNFIRLLREFGETSTGFAVFETKFEKRIVQYIASWKSEQQTPPVPARIYLLLISDLVQEFDRYDGIRAEFIEHLKNALSNPVYGRNKTSQRTIAHDMGITYYPTPELEDMMSNELRLYFRDKNIREVIGGLRKIASDIQLMCKAILHIFSGARGSEISYLNYNCARTERNGANIFCLIDGIPAKKREKGEPIELVSWVTSPIGMRAIRYAQEISELIYRYNPSGITIPEDRWFLFPSMVWACRNGHPNKDRGTNINPGVLRAKRDSECFNLLCPVIREEDIEELESIDPFRAWHEDPLYKVGNPWPTASTQLRRSLAVYGTNSGLVGISSITVQYNHMEIAMSEYYGRGSVHAKRILAIDPGHFCHLYQDEQPLAEGLKFLKDVADSDEPVYGPYALWLRHNLFTEGWAISTQSRQDVLNAFRKGLMAYQETFLGGCSKVGVCTERAMRSVVACLTCGSATLTNEVIRRSLVDVGFLLFFGQMVLSVATYDNSFSLESASMQLSDFDAHFLARYQLIPVWEEPK